MTTRWRQKIPFILVLILVVFLMLLCIFFWTALSNGVFTTNRNSLHNRININSDSRIKETPNWKKGKSKNIILFKFVSR